jgi:hypothetical protein
VHRGAAVSLKESRGESVAVLCIGRHLSRQRNGDEYRQAADVYYRQPRALGWNWDQCCLVTTDDPRLGSQKVPLTGSFAPTASEIGSATSSTGTNSLCEASQWNAWMQEVAG